MSFFDPHSENLSTDYRGRCGNCHALLRDDKYCRYCGKKRGEGRFAPYMNFNGCVYGSPYTVIHKCKKCGAKFKSSGNEIPRPEYCYNCGGKVSSDIEKKWEKTLKLSDKRETFKPKERKAPRKAFDPRELKGMKKFLYYLLVVLLWIVGVVLSFIIGMLIDI